jgi:hypothetical protein
MWGLPFGETSAFPHRTTKDLSYTPDEIRAYQDLGCLFVTQNADKFIRFLPATRAFTVQAEPNRENVIAH